VILAWDAKSHSYLPDIAAMRQSPPDEEALSASAKEIRAKLQTSPQDRPEPALWGRMRDLILCGQRGCGPASVQFGLALRSARKS